jgi:hypothetical protein
VTAGTGTEDYYRRWAPAYDEVYTRPERQSDLLAVRSRLTGWFAGKHVLEVAAGTRLLPGSLVVVIDNRLVPGSVHPVARRDEHGNTYQQRQLGDGSSREVLKNFPGPDEVRARLRRFGQSAEVEELDNYWLAWCRSPG